MKVAFFDAHDFEQSYFERALNLGVTKHSFKFVKSRLSLETAKLAEGCQGICAFVSDRIDGPVLKSLSQMGIRFIVLRSAGFNNVDMKIAQELGIKVARVPEYSPHAVAEHAVALLLCLNRKIHRAYNRIREGNFSLEGLVGYDLHGKTIGVIGTGRIGAVFAKIMVGFGAKVLAYDKFPNTKLESESLKFCELDAILPQADILSLHVPLTLESFHFINEKTLARTKKGVTIVNTSRGGLIDTAALIEGLKSGHVAAAGLDVYEEEEGVFFNDLSGAIIQDDVLARLMTFPNVLITSHQAFLTAEALGNIAATTIKNLNEFEQKQSAEFEIKV